MEPVLLLVVLLPSVVLHEVAHGALADRLGDDTARRAGRLTLNPIPHIDPFGTIILPALLAIAGTGIIGWAKPVPVRQDRLRRPRDHGLLVALVGPAVNVVLAVLAAVALRGVTQRSLATDVLVAVGVVNAILAAFNLLPVPPLDGSAVVERLLPRRLLPGWRRLQRVSALALVAVVVLIPTALSGIFGTVVRWWSSLAS